MTDEQYTDLVKRMDELGNAMRGITYRVQLINKPLKPCGACPPQREAGDAVCPHCHDTFMQVDVTEIWRRRDKKMQKNVEGV